MFLIFIWWLYNKSFCIRRITFFCSSLDIIRITSNALWTFIWKRENWKSNKCFNSGRLESIEINPILDIYRCYRSLRYFLLNWLDFLHEWVSQRAQTRIQQHFYDFFVKTKMAVLASMLFPSNSSVYGRSQIYFICWFYR